MALLRGLTCLALSLLLAASPVLAQERETVRGMSKRVYEAITEVQELLDAEQFDQALDVLEEQREKRMSSYETAHILNMMGYAYYQMDRMPEAEAAYREALEQKDLPESQIRGFYTTLAQLSLVSERFPEAEEYARKLLAMPSKRGLTPMDHVILAQALYGQERFEECIVPLRTAMAQQEELGQKPRENWLALLSSVYFEMEDFETMRAVVTELVTLYPKEQYLMNLAALHGQLGETDRQLALVEALLEDERLERGSYLLNLAQLFLAHQLPYKAASLLEQELEKGRIEPTEQNLQLQSQAWYLAGREDRAIAPLEQAAEMSEDGELYLRAARLYMDLYDFEHANKLASKALEKGGLKDTGDAHLLRGMALVRLERLDSAKSQFRLAMKSEETERWAQQWLKFVENEEQRLAALQ